MDNALSSQATTIADKYDRITIILLGGVFFIVSFFLYLINPRGIIIYISVSILIPSVVALAQWIRKNVVIASKVIFMSDSMIWKNKRNREVVVPYNKVIEVKPYFPEKGIPDYFFKYYNKKEVIQLNLLNEENGERLMDEVKRIKKNKKE